MNVRTTGKRLLLDSLPPAMAAYLRKERVTWSRQLKRNRRSLSSALTSRAFAKALLSPVEKNTVVWESFAGNGALCNPEALFRTMIDSPEYVSYRHIWVLSTAAWNSPIRAEFAKHPRVSFVRHRSRKYFDALETSEFLVNNATFPAEFIKRPEQTYLNVWHGTPLKKMGYDIENGADGARNVLRNFMSADYLLSQNSFMTETMYLDAYKLRNIFRGAIIEEGYPRTDKMFGPEAGNRARTELREHGIEIAGKKVLCYAPTWRGESFYNPQSDAARLKSTLVALRSALADKGWTVLLKAHQVIVDQLIDDADLADFLVPNDIPANDVLALTDLLVSDYSSIFIDFLATGRPVAFHVPDAQKYATQRGIYFGIEELPGPVSETVESLISDVTKLVSDTAAFPLATARYERLAAELTPHDDGAASARILDIVFGGRESDRRVLRGFEDGRIRLMLYLGGLITNGITSSVLNLLHQLDPEKYDITTLHYRSKQGDRLDNAALIPRYVRQVIRDQGSLQLPLLGSMQEFDESTSDDLEAGNRDAGLWSREWRRLFGHAEFDAAVDFSGYSSYWARIVAHGTAARRAVWLHNDLEADAMREVDGARPHFNNLTGVFKLYHHFDALVSVSPDLRAINATNLGEYAAAEKFVSARNVIDSERVRGGAGHSAAADAETEAIDVRSLSGAVAQLGSLYSLGEVISEASRQELLGGLLEKGSGRTFVTVGRLSPEKNQARLLRAFAEVSAEDPNVRLVVIGDGPLAGELRQLAVSLGISGAVEFTGRLRNPYAVMAAGDCFVLSSDYEGQPIVILEARVLGLPVVTTRFGSAASAMEGSGGLVVDRDVSALADGMRAFLNGEIEPSEFDPDAYNADVVVEFERAVFGR
ncbi:MULTISPECIES: glycosyltransferase [unclassified Brevibacterium]|uniref:glycosyltransferase n=1 Tax=unclassified Brevibacterium TaxID=2614124 RepID=UPI0010F67126|nr:MULTISPECIES: glycosyltransferase [unclassified Brevibacterium]MCM1011567.1 CDP-glycerol glycerophosphotransferase family protein [Brevibacterium sp. XM4083]